MSIYVDNGLYQVRYRVLSPKPWRSRVVRRRVRLPISVSALEWVFVGAMVSGFAFAGFMLGWKP